MGTGWKLLAALAVAVFIVVDSVRGDSVADSEVVQLPRNQCNLTQLNYCLTTYYAKAGLNGPFANAQAFAAAINAKILAAKANLFKVCQADRYLVECLGVPTYTFCLNGVELIRAGQTPTSAFDYQAIVAQSRFFCGGGYQTYLRQYACWKLKMAQHQKTLQTCAYFFGNQTQANPAKLCTYLPALAQCNQQVGNLCSAELGWSMCEATRLGVVNFSGDNCGYRCSVTQQANAEPPEQWPQDLLRSGLLHSPVGGLGGSTE